MISNSKINRKYGWIPSLPDHRALKYKRHAAIYGAEELPKLVDMRSNCPPVYDQQNLGACTASSAAGLAEFLMMKEKHPAFTPSRLFIYYNERVIEGTVSQDSGASMTDAIQVLTKNGAPPESEWWYNTSKFTVKPSKKVYADGLKHRISGAMSLDNTQVNELKSCLVNGYPFIFGITVYNSFESEAVAQTGIVPTPGLHEQQLGGHALMAIGYDDSKEAFIVRNSWGADWGLGGYCFLNYNYMCNTDYASDFWSCNLIS